MPRSSIRESDLKKLCTDWLEWNGYCVFRLNSGELFPEHNGKKHCVKLCREGTPDHFFFKPTTYGRGITRLYFLETKVPGKEPTTMQLIRMAELELYGAVCIVAHSLEEMIEAIEQIEKGENNGDA